MRERTVHLALRVTPAEAMLIRHMAEASMLTTSNYLRTIALRGDVRVMHLRALQAELLRQGGMLKHLAARGPLDHCATEEVLAPWREVIKKIAEIVDARQSHHA